MKNKLTLSIAITSLASIGAFSVSTLAAENTPHVAGKAAPKAGKCASGKCGTEKIYGKAALEKNPQDRLVRARDGKCGLTAEGYAVESTPRKKLAEGTCGQ
jgi:uncharacterized low-complexity protein